MRVLVVNAGSSSVKLDVVTDGVQTAGFRGLPDELPEVDAVGHRIVHGGPDLVEPVVIDAAVEQQLRALIELAPLHQPASLTGLDAVRRRLPGVPQVACFDTAFHATLPPAAYTYPIPAGWRRRWGVRRYGFHGLSHAWAARRARELVPGARRIVSCHLGAGASLAAILNGRSVDTTMGFTPLDGLVMATRSGSVDPGLLTWIQEREQLGPAELAARLEHDSGLLALSGTADMQELLARRDRDAQLAIEVYIHRLAGSIAAMTVGLGGLDVLVFTGGVGENAARIRELATAGVAHLGVEVDPERNRAAVPDSAIGADRSGVQVLVIASREDLEIAGAVERVLAGSPGAVRAV